MLSISYELISDLTFDLSTNEEVYVKINGTVASGVCSIKIVDPGAEVVVQASIASNEFYNLPSTTYLDLIWEPIKVNGVTIPIVTTDIPSATFDSPNIMYFKCVSPANEKVRIFLRGNR
jgi:hypothetical protein